MVPPSVDPAGVGVSEGEPCAASSSLPFEGCVGNATRPTPPGPPFTRGGKEWRSVLIQWPVGGSVRCVSLPTADCAASVRPIGLVGPMSNFVAPPQLVENVPYRDVAEMHRFARQWRDEHRKQWFTVPKLSGFCLLMKRAVYDKIGGLDERFGLGLFDDDDLAERARRAGFELAVAHDLFVHHFGSRTFLGNGIDIDRLLEENARRFAAKWGLAGGNNGRQVVAIEPWRQPERAVGNGVSAGASAEPCATPGGRGSVRAALTPAQQELRPPQNAYERPNWEGEAPSEPLGSAGARPPRSLRTQLEGEARRAARGSAGASPSPECLRTTELGGRGSVRAASTPAQQELRPPQNAYERPNWEGEARSEPAKAIAAHQEVRPPKIARTHL